MNRREGREKAFQVLFSMDNEGYDVDEAIELILDGETNEFINNLIHGVVKEKSTIDNKIETYLENWSMSRLANVEKTLMRIATYEMFYELDTPKGVAINEAIELAHVYGSDKSGQFINGVLAKMDK